MSKLAALTFFAVISFALSSGCVTERGAQELGAQFRQAFSPLTDMARSITGAQDLAYAIAAFQRKNGRWPADFSELSGFVQASDGFLALGDYNRVDLHHPSDGSLKVSFLPQGQTNLVSFTFPAQQSDTR